VLLAAGRLYSLGHVVNGKQNDPLVVAEVPAKRGWQVQGEKSKVRSEKCEVQSEVRGCGVRG